MATILLNTSDWVWYKKGNPGASAVVGYESSSRRVGRIAFTAPSTGTTFITFTFYTAGRGNGSHIPLKFYIGTDPNSHANAGYDYEATGTLTIGEDWMTFTGSADILLIPNQTYYLWVFPGEDTFGWYTGYRTNYTSTITTAGAAMSVIGGSNGTLGESNVLTLTRYSSYLTHVITAVCGSSAVTIATGVQADTVSWVPPIDWAAQNTTGTAVQAVITCTTFNGSTEVGSTSVTLNFAIPAYVVPSASIAVSDLQGMLAKYGTYVQGKSQAQVQASGDGAYGSSITGCTVACGSVSKTDTSPVFDLPDAGTIVFTVTVTDSRGRTASASTSIEVAAYSPPSAAILAAYRSDADGNQDDDGTYATAVFKGNVTPLNNANSARYFFKYRVKGTYAWTSVEVTSVSGSYAPEAAVQIVSISLDAAYELCVEAADDFHAIESLYRTVQVAFFLMSFHKESKAIGFGQKATEAGTAAFGLPAKFNAGIKVDGKKMAFVYSSAAGGYVLMESENV